MLAQDTTVEDTKKFPYAKFQILTHPENVPIVDLILSLKENSKVALYICPSENVQWHRYTSSATDTSPL